MTLTAKSSAVPRRPKFLLVGIAALLMMSLAVSVGTRFVHYYAYFHTVTAVQSNSPQPKRQDLEKDALQWTPPTPQIAILHAAVNRADLPSVEFLPSETLVAESLYNRPPPAR